MSFIADFTRVQKQVCWNSASKGFHDGEANLTEEQTNAKISQRLMLIVSELAEAMEALRKGNPPDNHIPKFSGMEAELADAVIRIMDLAETMGLRLAEAIIAKASYNSRREFKHGGKLF